jgi:hypothetical protein
MEFSELASRMPAWGRLFDDQAYAAFVRAIGEELEKRGLAHELKGDSVRIELAGASFDLPLLPLAEACAGFPREQWPEVLGKELQGQLDAEKLGRELDQLRGDFDKARSRVKLRLSRAAEMGPNQISAPVAGDVRAVLVLDLPSFVTPVRPADLAAWERPAPEVVRLALENVKSQEHVEVKPMEIAGTKVYAVSGQSVFVATLGLAAEDLVGPSAKFGALVAFPSRHILLCHGIADKRSFQVLQAMAAGSMQAFQGGPGALTPDLFWKHGDRFVAIPVREEQGKVTCDIPREFDEEVLQRL